jgi:hypothetical protein
MATKQFKVLGTTDERTSCDCCGRANLKATVALEDIETGDIVYFGSACGARAAGWPMKAWKSEVKAADDNRAAAERAAREAIARAEHARWAAFLDRAAGAVRDWSGKQDIFGQIQVLGGFKAARALYATETA